MKTTHANRTVILIQARFSSTRLPGKVLFPICETTLLGLLLNNLSSTKIPIYVLTSDSTSDDPVAEYCTQNHISYFRGPLEDVSSRFANFLKLHDYDYFIRISADSPLMDPEIVQTAIDVSHSGQFDLITNVLKRTFPKGQSVEMVNTRKFLSLQSKINTPELQEHVTKIFYETPDHFNIKNFESGADYGHIQLSVDTPVDFIKIEKMLQNNACKGAHWQYWTELEMSLNHA